MIPTELSDILTAGDPDDVIILLRAASLEPEPMNVTISVRPSEGVESQWKVSCVGLRTYRINNGAFDEIQELTDHPLLWEFNDKQVSLNIKGKTSNPSFLYAALVRTHLETFGTLVEFTRYLNPNMPMEALIGMEFGRFAEGPKRAMELYEPPLKSAGLNPYFTGEHEPRHWNGQQWVQATPAKLLSLGESWVIAEEFHWSKVKLPPTGATGA